MFIIASIKSRISPLASILLMCLITTSFVSVQAQMNYNLTWELGWGSSGGPDPAGLDTIVFPSGIQNRLACPTAGDLDNDGDLDMIISNQQGEVFFYENIGTPTQPHWGRRALPSLDTIKIGKGQNINQIRVELADIDNDGDLDLFCGSRWEYGTASNPATQKLDDIHFFRNIGTPSNPIFTLDTLPGLQNQQCAEFTSPCLADIDGDGDLDFLSLGSDSSAYFENIGTSTSPNFVRYYKNDPQNPLHGWAYPNMLIPTASLEDLDGDGDLDLFVCDDGGIPWVVENEGTTTTPDFDSLTLRTPPAILNNIDFGQFPSHEIADFNNDGVLDIIVSPFTPVKFYWFKGAPTTPVFSVSITTDSNVTCNGYSNGGATASINGGTTPYTYAWNTGITDSTITGLPAGTYSVTVTDSTGISDSATVTITEPTALMALAVVDSNVTCNGFANGGASASASGGTASYNYSWSNSATTASITGVIAGTYSITISDHNGCTHTTSATISEPAALVALTVLDSNDMGNGGGATATATGGTSPYTYMWNNGTTTASITGLVAGNYSVTISDHNSCTDSASISITAGPIPNIVIDSNISCLGSSDGGVTVAATGGTTPYTYLWNTGSTSASITGLVSGTYSVTVTDHNGLTDSTSIVLSDPAQIMVNTTVVVDSIGTTITNGVSPFSYAWSNSATTSSIDMLAPGSYTVTVTDNNGCSASQSATVDDTTDYFVTTWYTNSPNYTITIPTNSSLTYTYDVDWNGDNIFDDLGVTGNAQHQYATADTHTIKIRGTFPALDLFNYFNNSLKSKLLSVDQWGAIQWETMNGAFGEAQNVEILATDAPDLSMVTDMSYMFFGTSSMNQNISHWDVSNVKNMENLFNNASSFNQTLSTWDVSNVTTMKRMFSGASAFNQDISIWSVDSVENMESMFSGAIAFNQNIGSWNTGNVKNMEAMFADATVFNQDLSSWNTSSVTNMDEMFKDAEAFNQNIDAWDVSNVINIEGMFQEAISFNQNLNSWDVSKVKYTGYMFRDATAFNGQIGNWSLDSLVEAESMFKNASSFNQDISGWNTANVVYMQSMFEDATSFNQNIGGWDVGNVVYMNSIFEGATVFNQDISNWDVSSVERFNYAFYDATSFNQDIGNWNTSSVKYMFRMFLNASSFNQNLGNWNMSNVSNASSIFDNTPLSVENYDSTLIGWAAQSLKNGTDFGASTSQYCQGETARQNIITNFSWTISDNGRLCPPVVSTVVDSNVTCFGGTNGGATASTIDGTAPYTYLWSNGDTTSSTTMLSAGVHYVTVTDQNGKQDSDSVIISQPTQLVSSIVVDSNATCNGNNDGGATASASGGTASYNYAWSNSATTASITASITGLANSSYYITITDAHACTVIDTIDIIVEDTILPNVITQNINAYVDLSGNTSINTSDIDNGSSDACGIQSMQLDLTSFNCNNVGVNTVTLLVTDVNGNSDSATATVTVIDTLVPSIITQNINAYLGANGQVSITASDIDNGTTDNCGIASTSISQTLFTCGDIGANSVDFIAEDLNGNSDTVTITVTVLDTVSPNVSVNNHITYLDASGQSTITVTDIDNNSSDNCGIQSMTLDSTHFDCSETGYNTVTLTVTDNNGNTASQAATVTVVDSISPTVVVQNYTAYLNPSGTAIIQASDIDNGSSDNCAIQSLNLNQNTFSCADTGSNTVILQVTDVNGNINSASAIVTVMDTLAPTIIAQNIDLYLDVNGLASITTNDINNGSFDNCAIQSLVLDITNFDCSTVGTNSVTLTATDVSGNSNSTTATVTVLDTISPMVSTQDITVYLDAAGMISIQASDIDNGSNDNCSIQSLSLDISSFNCNDIGANTVHLAVTDVNGNTNSGTAVVNIMDTITPEIICPTNFSDCGPEIDIPEPQIQDNCLASWNLISGLHSGSTFPVGTTTNTYEVEDASGNKTTCSVDITRYPQPEIKLRGDSTVYYEQSLKLYSESEFVVEYQWSPTLYLDDPKTAEPICTPQETTEYTLIGKSSDGCFSYPKSVTIYVHDAGEILIPNTFSPNGDGYNDYFEIPGISSLPEMRVTIFNRNGEILYQKNGYQNDWDGTSNGKVLPVATYYYVIDMGNNKAPLKGDITIIK